MIYGNLRKICTLKKTIKVLKKTKLLLNHKSLHTLYCSLILLYLNCCVEVWGNTCKGALQ